MKRTKPPRGQVKYPAVDKKYTPKTRAEYLDIDYFDQLNEEEKEFINKFYEEDLQASFKRDGSDLFDDTERKASYGRNNARNRCMYTRAKAMGRVMDSTNDVAYVREDGVNQQEDYLIAKIDKDSE